MPFRREEEGKVLLAGKPHPFAAARFKHAQCQHAPDLQRNVPESS